LPATPTNICVYVSSEEKTPKNKHTHYVLLAFVFLGVLGSPSGKHI